MLIIREPQMAALGAGMRAAFERDCVALLRRHYPSRTATDEHMLAFVRDETERAGRCGIRTVDGVERWLHLAMRLGARFDEAPQHAAVRNVLADEARPVEERLDAAEALVPAAGPHPPHASPGSPPSPASRERALSSLPCEAGEG